MEVTDLLNARLTVGDMVFVFDNEYLGTEEGNIVRKFLRKEDDQFIVQMNDGQEFSYQNAVKTESLQCPNCNCKELAIGRMSEEVSQGYAAACVVCEQDFYLVELLKHIGSKS